MAIKTLYAETMCTVLPLIMALPILLAILVALLVVLDNARRG